MSKINNRYEIIHKLGRDENSFATVYLARDTHLNRSVALKVLPNSIKEGSPQFDQFRTHARQMAGLTLDAVSNISDFGLWEAKPYIVATYMPHGALTDKLASAALSFDDTAQLLSRLAGALDYAHALGISHGDLKPNNILFTAENQATLADFGFLPILKTFHPEVVKLSDLVDEQYCAPELFDANQQPSLRSDVYSLGCVLWACLTKTAPYSVGSLRGLRRKHRKNAIPNIEKVAIVPTGLNAVFQTALAKDPADRFASFSDFAEAFVALREPRIATPTVAQPEPEATAEVATRNTTKLAAPKPDRAELPDELHPLEEHETQQLKEELPEIASAAAIAAESEQDALPAEPEEETFLVDRLWRWLQIPLVKVGLHLLYASFLVGLGVLIGQQLAPSVDPNAVASGNGSDLTQTVVDVKGHEMVYVPQGDFVMGSTIGDTDEMPVHTVTLDPYFIDKFEVTNEQFAIFLNEVGNFEEDGKTWVDEIAVWDGLKRTDGVWSREDGYINMPMVGMTWYGAAAYCEWRGGDLPTEAQWEKAARGETAPLYPWGNTYDATKANVCDTNCERNWANDAINDGYMRAAPIGSFPEGSSQYGVFDMAGNVAELTADWQDGSYYQYSPRLNPTGPPKGNFRVVRGGSFYFRIEEVRSSNRNGWLPTDRTDYIGFRCVVPAN